MSLQPSHGYYLARTDISHCEARVSKILLFKEHLYRTAVGLCVVKLIKHNKSINLNGVLNNEAVLMALQPRELHAT